MRSCKLQRWVVLMGFLASGERALAQQARPDWDALDAGFCTKEGRLLGMATGRAEGIFSENLSRSTAENRARAALVRLINGVEVTRTVQSDATIIRSTSHGTLSGSSVESWRDPDTCGHLALAQVEVEARREVTKEPSCRELLGRARGASKPAPRAAPTVAIMPGHAPGKTKSGAEGAWLVETGDRATLPVHLRAVGGDLTEVQVQARLRDAHEQIRFVEPTLQLPRLGNCDNTLVEFELESPELVADAFESIVTLEVKAAGAVAVSSETSFPLQVTEPSSKGLATAKVPSKDVSVVIKQLHLRDVDGDGRLQPGDLILATSTLVEAPPRDVTLALEGMAKDWTDKEAPPAGLETERSLRFRLPNPYRGPAEIELDFVLVDAGGQVHTRRSQTVRLGLALERPAYRDNRRRDGRVFQTVLPAKLGLGPEDERLFPRWLGLALNQSGAVVHIDDSRRGKDPSCSTRACQEACFRGLQPDFVAALRVSRKKSQCTLEATWTLNAERKRNQARRQVACERTALFDAAGALASEIASSVGLNGR